MSRQIKFRGKRLDNGKWVYGDLLHPRTSCRIVNYTDSEDSCDGMDGVDYHYYDVDPETVGQFTGYTDIKNKEIYDGDIVRDKYDGIGKICFMMYGWSIDYGDDDVFVLSESIHDNDGIEVIGNEFDNLDLLK